MKREKVRLCLRVVVSLAMVLLIFNGLAHAQQRYSLSPYYPLTEGATWTYVTVKTPNPNDIEVYSMAKISDSIKGNFYRRFLFDSGEQPYSYQDMNWTRNGLEVYKAGEKDLLAGGGSDSYTIYDPPLLRFPASMSIGSAYTFVQTGTATEYVNGTPGSTYNYSWKITLEGIDDIETYIGTFAGCLKFAVEFKTTDSNGGTIEDEKWTFWLARGYGQVRSEEIPGPEHTEILSYTKGNTTYYPIP
jgi:hypothetical protein